MGAVAVSPTIPITNRKLNITDRFASQCSAVIDTDYDTSGTITRASISYLNKDQLDAIYAPGGLFADLDAWFRHSIEMRACGVQRFALYDWIMANADRTGFRAALFPGVKSSRGPTIVQPFIMGRQQSIINDDHWKITAGWDTAAAMEAAVPAMNGTLSAHTTFSQGGNTYGVGHGTCKVIRVESGGNSAGTSYGTPPNQAFFAQMDTIHIFNTANGLNQHGAWRVIYAANDATQTYCYVLVQDINNVGEPFDTQPGQNNQCVIVRGLNNVNVYEKWCNNRPTLDPRKMVPFWRQVSRDTRAVDSEYLLVYSKLMESNIAFREFGDLPMAERNKQDELRAQKNFVEEFFYNKPLQYQDLVNWQSLDQIQTVAGATLSIMASKLVAYRANFVGVREQLRQCGQVLDLASQPLNLYEFLDLNYAIMRARSTFYGKQIKEIDWFTNSQFAALFLTAYTTYIGAEFTGVTPTLFIKPSEVNSMGQTYRSYEFKYPAGLKINILTDFWFDDRLNNFMGVSQPSAGNVMWALDIGKPRAGSIYWAQIASNRRTTTTADINLLSKLDSTYKCVMEVMSEDITLTSNEGTAVVECPLGNAMVENFSLAVPNTSGRSLKIKGSGALGSYTDLYQ